MLAGLSAWPPPAESFNDLAARAIPALLAPIAAITYSFNLREPSRLESEWQSEELEQKQAELQVAVEGAEGLLAELASRPRGAAPKGACARAGRTPGPLVARLLELCPDCADERVTERFFGVWQVSEQVAALERGHPLVATGLCLSARLLVVDLSRLVHRVLGDGGRRGHSEVQLKELLGHASTLRDTIYKMYGYVGSEDRARLARLDADILLRSWAGFLALGSRTHWDALCALRLLAKARRDVLVLLCSSVLAAANGSLEVADVVYRYEIVELTRTRSFEWATWRRKFKALVGVRIVRWILWHLCDRVKMVGQSGLEHSLRTMMYAALLRQDFSWYRLGQRDQRDVRAIFDQIFKMPEQVKGVLGAVTSSIEVAASTVGQAIVAYRNSSSLLSFLVALKWGSQVLEQVVRWLVGRVQERMEREAVKVELQWIEPLVPENLSTVRSNTAEGRTLKHWDMFWQHNMRKDHRKSVVYLMLAPFFLLYEQLVPLGSLVCSAQLVKRGELEVVDFDATRTMAESIGASAQKLLSAALDARDNIFPLARAWEIITTGPTIGLEGGVVPEGRASGAIAFEGVEFGYEEGRRTIKDMSFEVGAGTTCAITGATGGGKSTIFKLLQRFYDPTAGRILLDGRDIRELSPSWLRRQLSVVDQHPRVFSTSLRANLTYGCDDDPPDEAVEAACRAAGIHELVFESPERFPAGLHSRVSQHTLSGGELQRLSMARALLRDAPVVLLDEATSSLDSRTQRHVNAALARLSSGKTVLTIAHRLETIKDAGQTLCVEGGAIVERGSHADLVARGGVYAEIYRTQVTTTLVE